MAMGSSSPWLMLAGSTARPRAISSRMNSGVTCSGSSAPKALAVLDQVADRLAAQVLADGDELHLGRDHAATGVGHLGDRLAGFGAHHRRLVGELRHQIVCGDAAVVLGPDIATLYGLHVASAVDPGVAGAGQALLDVHRRSRVGEWARRVVDRHRRLVGARMHLHLTERHADVGVQPAGLIDFARAGDFARGDGAGGQDAGRGGVHRRPSVATVRLTRNRRGREAGASLAPVPSLRRHDPDQVRRIAGLPASQPLRRGPPENASSVGERGGRHKRGRLREHRPAGAVGLHVSPRSPTTMRIGSILALCAVALAGATVTATAPALAQGAVAGHMTPSREFDQETLGAHGLQKCAAYRQSPEPFRRDAGGRRRPAQPGRHSPTDGRTEARQGHGPSPCDTGRLRRPALIPGASGPSRLWP